MPDTQKRNVEFTLGAQNLRDGDAFLKLTDASGPRTAWIAMSREEAHELFFQLGDQLGFTWEKRKTTGEKVEEAVKAAVQTALNGAAVATLSDMGYAWQGGARWKPPVGQKPDFDQVDALRNRITVLTQQAEAQDKALQLAKASADGWQKAAAKLREESTDSNSAWHRGQVVGYTSGSAAERERCGDIAQRAADRLDSAIAMRIAQEIKNPA